MPILKQGLWIRIRVAPHSISLLDPDPYGEIKEEEKGKKNGDLLKVEFFKISKTYSIKMGSKPRLPVLIGGSITLN